MSTTNEEGSARPTRLLTRPFVVVTATAFIFFIYIGMLIPIVPLFIEGPLRRGEFGIGLTIAAFAGSAILARPFLGRIADRTMVDLLRHFRAAKRGRGEAHRLLQTDCEPQAQRRPGQAGVETPTSCARASELARMAREGAHVMTTLEALLDRREPDAAAAANDQNAHPSSLNYVTTIAPTTVGRLGKRLFCVRESLPRSRRFAAALDLR